MERVFHIKTKVTDIDVTELYRSLFLMYGGNYPYLCHSLLVEIIYPNKLLSPLCFPTSPLPLFLLSLFLPSPLIHFHLPSIGQLRQGFSFPTISKFTSSGLFFFFRCNYFPLVNSRTGPLTHKTSQLMYQLSMEGEVVCRQL